MQRFRKTAGCRARRCCRSTDHTVSPGVLEQEESPGHLSQMRKLRLSGPQGAPHCPRCPHMTSERTPASAGPICPGDPCSVLPTPTQGPAQGEAAATAQPMDLSMTGASTGLSESKARALEKVPLRVAQRINTSLLLTVCSAPRHRLRRGLTAFGWAGEHRN